MTIRVLIADDEDVIREALGALVNHDEGCEVVATAHNTDSAIAMAESSKPDVAILDVKMPGGGGARAAREIRTRSPETRIVAYSAYEDRSCVLEMIRAGALGYLVKGGDPRGLIDAVYQVVEGNSALSGEVATEVLVELADKLEMEQAEVSMRKRQQDAVLQALHDDILYMVFQPVMHLPTMQICGYEALARFATEVVRPPHVWFADASSAGLLEELELAAASSAMEAQEMLPPEMSLMINVSPDTIVSDTFATWMDERDMTGVVFEITEHAPIEDYDQISRRLAILRSAGARLAVDDAGAGFASLRHILRLNPEVIKLDITLTQRIDMDSKRKALGSALIAFAGEMGADVIAEGIETKTELDALVDLGVNYGQGYFLGKPGPISASWTAPEGAGGRLPVPLGSRSLQVPQ
jgi:EAL domain-containing protein (putative c-di-GMP-specific phosphodiesterase class I)/DNA-binding NarL/FixJ family response regulator